MMTKKKIASIGWASVAVMACMGGYARGGVIFTTPGQFVALARGQLFVDRNASIVGNIGGGSSVSLARDGFYDGNIFAQGSLAMNAGMRVNGRIVSNGDLSIHRNADVSGSIDSGGAASLGRDGHFGPLTAHGDTSLGTGVNMLGDLRSSGSVFINRNSTIYGDVVHGGGFSTGRNVTIAGGVSVGMANPDSWEPQFRPVPTLSTTGSGTISFGVSSNVNLDPGDYGHLSIDRNSTLLLSAGTYNFDSVSLARDVAVLMDNVSGGITINLVGDATFGSRVSFDLIDDAGGGLLFQSGGNTLFHRNAVIEGDFRVFGDSLTLRRDVAVRGSLYSNGSISLGPGVVVVPSPSGAVVLAMFGLAGIASRRRRSLTRSV